MPETADRTESLFAAAAALRSRNVSRIWNMNAPATRPCATGYWLCSKPMIAPVM